ncbi:MAG TPA: hypothetical protein VEF76_02265 [Patescibacteria group bacterium]|nr:hypothetical protein [Patescibacteria group bacterium]
MTLPTPDFRKMTPEDLKRDISALNRQIKLMKKMGENTFAYEIEEAEELRAKYKIVWRARPGRTFHDVAARKEHQKLMRRYKHGPRS